MPTNQLMSISTFRIRPTPRTGTSVCSPISRPPTSTGTNPSAALPSHLQRVYADQLSQVVIPDPGFEA
jgi:hypothetical protein